MKPDERCNGANRCKNGCNSPEVQRCKTLYRGLPFVAPAPTEKVQGQSDPLATPGLIRFLLGKTASAMLADAGEFFLIEARQSKQPEHEGRFIAYALPITKDKADAAARVAKGTHRATKIRKP